MRMPRLFIEQALVAGTEITLHDARDWCCTEACRKTP
jgi:hypothetical protein